MQETNTESEPTQEPGGIDSIISRVDSYIENPKLVTPETLTELRNELVDLKSYLDGEETSEGEQSQGGLSAAMEKMKGR